MFDLLITGGTVVDGLGGTPRRADIGITGTTITTIGDLAGCDAVETIDATGKVVTPGWVDVHTHYDGQVTWDEVLQPSSQHGVTTIVTGNCGVGFAPAAPDRHEWLIALMEGVEDIPGTALAEGMTWGWESFPEYLDVLDDRRWTMDVGTQISHGAVRAYVMGDRGARNEPATSEDIAQMAGLVEDALRAGALGFSTSRTLAHRAADGEPVPGTFAMAEELFGIGGALKRVGTGVYEVAPLGTAGEDVPGMLEEVSWMAKLSKEIGRPVTYALLQVDGDPNAWSIMVEKSVKANADGASLRPQIAGRPTGLLSGHFTTYSLFDLVPAYAALKAKGLPEAEFFAALEDPAFRRSIIEWEPTTPEDQARVNGALRSTFLLGTPPNYEPRAEDCLEELAKRQGLRPFELAYDACLADGGHGLLYIPILNYSLRNLDHVAEMFDYDEVISGLADGGAHVGTICDASLPTYLLTHWVRDRDGKRMTLEAAVKKQTHDTAQLYGLTDRGRLTEGALADVNVINFDELEILSPRVVADLPAGGRRILQGARGYEVTIKSGVVTYRAGEPTGERPGVLLRGAR
jgi:N-acyl-D-aspartate/D-glutamate deacylase